MSPAFGATKIWPVAAFLMSAKMGVYACLGVYIGLQGMTSIRTFSSGALTSTGVADKSRDYGAAAAFILVAVAAFIVAMEIASWIRAKYSQSTLDSLGRNIIFANIPAIFSLSGLFFADRLNLNLALLSSAGEVILICCMIAQMTAPSRYAYSDINVIHNLNFDWVLPALVFAFFAGALTPQSWFAIYVLVTDKPIPPMNLDHLSAIGGWVLLLLAGIVSIIVFARSQISSVARCGHYLLIAAQLLLVFGCVRLIGPLLQAGLKLQLLVEISTVGIVCIIVLMAIAIAYASRSFAAVRSGQGEDLFRSGRILNPLAVVLAGLVLKTSFDRPLSNLIDEYHTGEFALPYWALTKFGLFPYLDLDPARGWVMLMYGWFGEVFFKPGYANYAFVGPYFAFAVLLFLFFAIRPLIGGWLAFLLVCFAPPPNTLTELDLGITGLMAILCYASKHMKPAMWLLLWVVLGTIAVLYAPGQGGLLVFATSLLGCARFAEAYTVDRTRLKRNLIFTAVLVVIFCLLTPVGRLVFGAVRYGIEQSSANTEMNSIAFSLGKSVSLGLWWEIIRISWMLVTIGIGVAAYQGLRRHLTGSDRIDVLKASYSSHFVLGLPLFILGVLYIPRAGGRIDPGSASRLGYASLWFVGTLLPLYLFVRYRVCTAWQPIVVLSVTAATGLIASFIGYSWTVRPFDRIMMASGTINGADVGLSSLGRYVWDMDWIKKRIALKTFVDSKISDKETFVDLTNRSSLYYILDRRPAIASSVYNMTTRSQQLRAIAALQSNPPKLALFGPDAIRHDGGAIGLRSPLLYRYFVENYRPVEGGGGLWLEPRTKTDASSQNPNSLSDAEIALLVKGLGQPDLGPLPYVWGGASRYLNRQMNAVHRIDFSKAVANDGILAGEKVTSTGQDTFAVVDISALNLRGIDAGLLSFNFACDDAKTLPILQLLWTTDRQPNMSLERAVTFHSPNGKFIVPMDIAPNWLLAEKITELRFNLTDRKVCPSWTISDVTLSQRSDVAEARRLWTK